MSWTCPNCDRELPAEGQRHYCARVSLDTLFEGRSPDLVLTFDKILAEVADWPDVLVGVTPNCIVFTHKVAFLIIRPLKKVLDVKYYSKEVRKKTEQHARVAHTDELTPELFKAIRHSYHFL